MIPQRYIEEWRAIASWTLDAQVEQDLVMTNLDMDTEKVIRCYKTHMKHAVDKMPTRKQFLVNMNGKMREMEFMEDIRLVLKQEIEYDHAMAWELVKRELIEKL